MEKEKHILNNQEAANEVYRKLNIDKITFPSMEEIGANYQKQMINMQRDSIEKSSYFLCK